LRKIRVSKKNSNTFRGKGPRYGGTGEDFCPKTGVWIAQASGEVNCRIGGGPYKKNLR